MSVLKGSAVKIDLTIEENTLWERVFHNLVDDAVDQNSEHEPFEAGTTAYFTAVDKIGGTVLFTLGPEVDDLDGTTLVDAPGGLISLSLPREKSVNLALRPPRYLGWYNLDILHAGDEARRFRYSEGELVFSRCASVPEIAP